MLAPSETSKHQVTETENVDNTKQLKFPMQAPFLSDSFNNNKTLFMALHLVKSPEPTKACR